MKANQAGAKPKRYPSDLTRNQWKKLKRLLPKAKPGGRPRSVNLREVLNGVFYVARGGGSWRMMPKDLPPWSTCYDYFRKWRNDGTWSKLNDALRTRVRHQAQRKKSPSMAIIDSQSARTTEQGGPRGKDAGSCGASGGHGPGPSTGGRWNSSDQCALRRVTPGQPAPSTRCPT